MSLVINTNLASLTAQRNLTKNNEALKLSIERLSSGLRINSAKDDAAGLAISEKLRAHVRSINQAVRNSQDGTSLTQVAEGAMGEISNILIRMRELAQQSANGSLGDTERGKLDQEYQALTAEINRIADITEFNGTKLLNGSLSSTGISLQVGFQNASGNTVNVLSGLSGAASLHSQSALGLTGASLTISVVASAAAALSMIDSAISNVAGKRGDIGAAQNRLEITISNLRVASENFSAAESRIRDADFAYETAVFTKNQILTQASMAVLSQANTIPQMALQLLK
ncbi:MAG: flagellin FliC [Nitrospirae bacterium]|nr:flagellin FliC [Nitrospirota bacterium]